MDFDDLVDRVVSLYDVSTTRASAAANERLQRMVSAAKSIRTLRSLGTTVADTATYALDTDIVQVYRVRIAFDAGDVIYHGTESVDTFWDLAVGDATAPDCGNYFVVEPDTDSTQTTDNLRLFPVPSEAGATITGLVAIIPAVITYGSTTALPIPLDCHEHLLAGVKAELSDEESRQDEAQKFEVVFEAGVRRLEARQVARGSGSDRHRMRVAGYDINR